MDIAAVDGVSCTDTAIDAPCANLARTLAYLPDAGAPDRADLLLRRRRAGDGLRPLRITATTSTPATTAERGDPSGTRLRRLTFGCVT